MPRIRQNKLAYNAKDFVIWLVGTMKVESLTQTDIAEMLNISQPAVSAKIRKRNFTYEDKMTIFDELKTPKEKRAELLL